MRGPVKPTIMAAKMAGFLRMAHRMYCRGASRNSTGAMLAVYVVASPLADRYLAVRSSNTYGGCVGGAEVSLAWWVVVVMVVV